MNILSKNIHEVLNILKNEILETKYFSPDLLSELNKLNLIEFIPNPPPFFSENIFDSIAELHSADFFSQEVNSSTLENSKIKVFNLSHFEIQFIKLKFEIINDLKEIHGENEILTVFSDSIHHEKLLEINQICLKSKKPWILIIIDNKIQLGPIFNFNSEVKYCFKCVQSRFLSNQKENISYVLQQKFISKLNLINYLYLCWIEIKICEFLISGFDLQNRVIEFNYSKNQIHEADIIPVFECDACEPYVD